MIAICALGNRYIPSGCERWGLAQDYEVHTLSRVFELHDWEREVDRMTRERLLEVDAPIYMRLPRFHNAVRYPIEEVIETGRDYFTCTVAYMVALAVHEHKPFSLHGVTLDEDRYDYQRACIEYWLGVADGLGLKYDVSETPLLKFKRHPSEPEYKGRYGYL